MRLTSRVLLTLGLALLGTWSTHAYKRKLKFCKFDYALECFIEPMARFTSQANGTGLATDEQEFEQLCFNIHDYMPYCVQKWAHRCAPPIHRELINRFVLLPMQQSMRTMCDTKGTIRSELIKQAQCTIEKVKTTDMYRGDCVRELHSNSEYVHDQMRNSSNLVNFITGHCCVFNRWLRCITGHLKRECGEPAEHIFPYFIHHLTMHVFASICPLDRYDPEREDVCAPQLFRAPKDYRPIGYGSASIFSSQFAYICPNVGWGIDKSRDF